jgi:signal transduction histidine kinase
VQFERYVPPIGILPSHNIYSLMATPEGGLWISFNPSGLGFLKDGHISLFSRPEELPRSEVFCFARDLNGRIWGGTRTGLALFDGSRWLDVASDWNFTNHRIWTMFVDRDGTLWVATDDTLVFLQRDSKVFQQTGTHLGGVPQIAQAKDGRLWMSDWFGPLRPIPVSGRGSAAESPEIRDIAVKFLFDQEGSLWMTGGSMGVRRLRFPERLGNRKLEMGDPDLESFREQDGLTSNSANNVFEDREGNIWVSSNKGLDRFRHSNIVPVNLPPGHRDLTLLAGNNGEVWVASGSQKPLLRIQGEYIVPKSTSMEISSVYHDSNGVVWWGGHGGIWRQRNDRFDFFPQPKGMTSESFDWLWEVIPDDLSGGLWVRLGDFGLIHFKDGVWTNAPKPSGLLDVPPSASYHDSYRRTWLGYKENRVYFLKGERVQAYSHDDGLDIGRIRVIRGHGPQVWLGGELGLAVFEHDRFRTVRTTGEPFGTVSGIVETPDGALWLNELHGVVRISPEEVRQVAEQSDYAVHYQIYDFLDGLPGAPQMHFRCSTAIQATDGRLWFATDNGLAWIDPAHVSKNKVPPPAAIRSIIANERSYSTFADTRLPASIKNLRIDYTALSLSIPERVRFRYKLDGIDKDWNDAGTRRQAFYNNLHPGKYRFRVIACNNDGVWNEEGATLNFSIAPAWNEASWFRALCVAAFLGLLWALYQFRLHQLQRQLNAGLEARMNERTRIARELHDTLLQSFHGLMFQFQAARNMLPRRPEEAIQALDGAISATEQAITESRGAIQDLRSENIAQSDLAELITTMGQELTDVQNTNRDSPIFRVIVEGERRTLAPVLQNEVCRIAREILLNAVRHAHAHRIEAEIRYDDQGLRLRIRDDGRGLDPKVLEEGGSVGHWGLRGMRERAQQLGAQLDFWSEAGAGTEVQLTVPAAVAYKASQAGSRFKLFQIVKGYGKRS